MTFNILTKKNNTEIYSKCLCIPQKKDSRTGEKIRFFIFGVYCPFKVYLSFFLYISRVYILTPAHFYLSKLLQTS